MGKIINLSLDQVTEGQSISVWIRHLGGGLGGTVVDLDRDGDLVIETPLGALERFPRSGFADELAIEAEVPYEARDCHGFRSGGCEGEVQMHTPGGTARAVPRCAAHAAERNRIYDRSMERYADQRHAPAWFDPTVAGEHWDED